MWCKIEGYHLKWSIIGVWAETADPYNIIFRTNPYPDQVQEPVVLEKNCTVYSQARWYYN